MAYYKPVQSGIELEDGSPSLTDTDFIGQTALLPQDKIHCSYGFKSPVSLHLASEQEQIAIDPDRIISTCRRILDRHDYTVVEGAGGIAVPIVRNSFMVDDMIRDNGSSAAEIALKLSFQYHQQTALRGKQRDPLSQLYGMTMTQWEHFCTATAIQGIRWAVPLQLKHPYL